MAGSNPTLLVITLNINGLNMPSQRIINFFNSPTQVLEKNSHKASYFMVAWTFNFLSSVWH